MPAHVDLATNVSQIIKQTETVGERLQELVEQLNAPTAALGCLSTEVFLIETALKKLPEYAWKPNKVSQLRDPKIASDLDEVLLAIAVILHEISLELETLVFKKVKRFSLKRKVDLEGPLLRLRARQSALRLLLTVVSMTPGDEAKKRLEANAAAIEVIRNERTDSQKQLGIKNMTYPYTIKLLDDPDGSFEAAKSQKRKGRPPRLTSELVRYGLSPEDVQKIYDESGLKPWLVTEMFQRLKSYGSKEDYRSALATLVKRNQDFTQFMERMAALSEDGPPLYSQQLGALRACGYDLDLTRRRLMELKTLSLGNGDFHGINSGWIYRFPSIKPTNRTQLYKTNHIRIIEALYTRDYSFDALQQDINDLLEFVRQDGQPTSFCCSIILQFWEQQSFAPVQTMRNRLDSLDNATYAWLRPYALSPWGRITWACLFLCRFSFQDELLVRGLERLDAGISADLRNDAESLRLLIVLSFVDYLLDAQTLITTLIRLVHKFRTRPGYRFLFRLAYEHYFNISRLLELETVIETAFPPDVVESGECWDLFQDHNYDLDLTLRDARAVASGDAAISTLIQRARAQKPSYFEPVSTEVSYNIPGGEATWVLSVQFHKV